MQEFPQYRKLKNNRSFYRIENLTHFTEIQIIGTKTFLFKLHATQYPEMVKIKDMLNGEDPFQMSDKIEFDLYSEKLNP
jgi:hypothetical protein